ncbi:MAG: 50S ribosomal protein L21 [Alphaproteobacteria bacterium]
MFAVVKTGGKQYKVAQGDVIQVEKIEGAAGNKVQLAQVLLINDNGKAKVGAPFVTGAKVEAEIMGQERSRKVIVFKKKRRQNYRRKNTHRQDYTILRITGIAV